MRFNDYITKFEELESHPYFAAPDVPDRLKNMNEVDRTELEDKVNALFGLFIIDTEYTDEQAQENVAFFHDVISAETAETLYGAIERKWDNWTEDQQKVAMLRALIFTRYRLIGCANVCPDAWSAIVKSNMKSFMINRWEETEPETQD